MSTICQSAFFYLLDPELGSCLTAEQAHFTHFTSAKPLLSCNVQRSPVHNSLFRFQAQEHSNNTAGVLDTHQH